jgi:hypothetical protein
MKKHTEYADSRVDEQAITDKFNAATAAQFNVQREQNRQAENQFYNQMYNTQQTAMDTIRKSNAAAVSTGASRGVQAANELSAILGLEKESVAGATELAQANRQTAQEETAAVLENVLKAYQQAVQEKQTAVQQSIESASVDVQQEANQTEAQKVAIEQQKADIEQQRADTEQKRLDIEQQQANTQAQQQKADQARLITEAAENGTNTYLTALTQAGIDYSNGVITPESQASFQVALANIGRTKDGTPISFNADDWAGSKSGGNKANEIINTINNICDAYGLDKTAYQAKLNDLKKLASNTNVSWAFASTDKDAMENLGISVEESTWTVKTSYARMVQDGYQSIINQLQSDYASGANRKSK